MAAMVGRGGPEGSEPTHDNDEAREIVQSGYDLVADRYAALEAEDETWPRMRWLEKLLAVLDDGSEVLDVGCGNGLPATRAIAERHKATGIDLSAAQIDRARRNVPDAKLIQGDLMTVDIAADSYDAIAAFYVIEHVPRESHAALFERLHNWLLPSGHLLFTIEPDDNPGKVGDWLGAPMFFSQYEADQTLSLLRDAGFEVVDDAVETQLEGEREVSYMWVLARRVE
jgi:cyclopropane fatty-acyl-phospholipid synthase-like methyltransferase